MLNGKGDIRVDKAIEDLAEREVTEASWLMFKKWKGKFGTCRPLLVSMGSIVFCTFRSLEKKELNEISFGNNLIE